MSVKVEIANDADLGSVETTYKISTSDVEFVEHLIDRLESEGLVSRSTKTPTGFTSTKVGPARNRATPSPTPASPSTGVAPISARTTQGK